MGDFLALKVHFIFVRVEIYWQLLTVFGLSIFWSITIPVLVKLDI